MSVSGFSAIVTDIRREAEGVVSFAIARADGGAMPAWQPGAHIDLLLRPDLSRQYSLCGDPGDAISLRFAVLREAKSRGGSEMLHGAIKIGDRLAVADVRNNFALVEGDEFVMIAGGIGITPILTMVQALEAAGKRWSLLYGGRKRGGMAFVDALAAYGEKVSIRPEDEYGLLDLKAAIGTYRPGKIVYGCGPEPLIKALEAYCADWPEDALQIERFRPIEQEKPMSNTSFEVELKRKGIVVTVPADQSIAEAIEAAGVYIPRSCNEGTCGTCLTKVLEGEPDHRDSFLRPKQREQNNRILVCCSRAFSPRLVLDV